MADSTDLARCRESQLLCVDQAQLTGMPEARINLTQGTVAIAAAPHRRQSSAIVNDVCIRTALCTASSRSSTYLAGTRHEYYAPTCDGWL